MAEEHIRGTADVEQAYTSCWNHHSGTHVILRRAASQVDEDHESATVAHRVGVVSGPCQVPAVLVFTRIVTTPRPALCACTSFRRGPGTAPAWMPRCRSSAITVSTPRSAVFFVLMAVSVNAGSLLVVSPLLPELATSQVAGGG
ncbi:MAG: hypothetical protein LC799_30695 [Actinobacteria bacterium]|nr:hypothetical protein [Actinomycetota bacterium]